MEEKNERESGAMTSHKRHSKAMSFYPEKQREQFLKSRDHEREGKKKHKFSFIQGPLRQIQIEQPFSGMPSTLATTVHLDHSSSPVSACLALARFHLCSTFFLHCEPFLWLQSESETTDAANQSSDSFIFWLWRKPVRFFLSTCLSKVVNHYLVAAQRRPKATFFWEWLSPKIEVKPVPWVRKKR